MVTKIKEILRSYPSVRVIPSSSGCAETDSRCKPFELWCGGSTLKAEKTCDTVFDHLVFFAKVRRIGPRSLKVTFR